MRVGSIKRARLIAEFYDDGDDSETAPSGWEYLGAGWSRTAYLGPDEVVYKVGLNYVNRQERHNVAVLGKIDHPKIRIPATTSWTVKGIRCGGDNFRIVNAMEFIKGTHAYPGSSDYDHNDVFSKFLMQDGFAKNYIVTDKGLCYIIDLGETRKKFNVRGELNLVASSR